VSTLMNNGDEMNEDIIDLSKKESLDLLYQLTKNSIDSYQESTDRGDKDYELALYEAQNRHAKIIKMYEANGFEIPIEQEEKAKVA